MRVAEPEDMEEAARRIHLMGPRYVLVKGGHLKGDATDLLWNGREFTRFTAPRVDSQNTHGTGCTFSAAIAAGLARGQALGDAIRAAKAYVTRAIREGFQAGPRRGPAPPLHPGLVMSEPERAPAPRRRRPTSTARCRSSTT